ncbi:MAG: LysR substrate-binding domain-containing protein [Planktomarina sp.]
MSEMFHAKDLHPVGAGISPVPNVPPYLLVSFAEVATQRSMAHAATKQCMPYTQMAQNMARLEGLVGTPLITPDAGRFTLTETGRKLFSAIKQDVQAIHTSAQTVFSEPFKMGASEGAPTLAVGLSVWGMASILRPYLADLQGLGCDLNFVSANSFVDTAPDVVCYLGKSPKPGYESEVLFGEEIIAVAAPHYPMPEEGFEAEAFKYEPLLRLSHQDHLEDWQGYLGIDPEMDLPGIKKDPYRSFSTYLRAIKAGRGIGVGLAPLFAADILAGHLKIASARRVWRNRAVYLGVSKDSNHLSYARDFAGILRRAIEDIGHVGTQ